MVKYYPVLSILFLCGCTLLRPYEEHSFSFQYGGDDYKIVSKVQGDEVVENLLLMIDASGKILFEAIDKDSNGEIDEIRRGDLTITEANRIYYAGIEQALESGNLQSRHERRLFEFSAPPYLYKIETIGYDDYTSRRRMVYGYVREATVHNQFTLTDLQSNVEYIFNDVDADGILNVTISPEEIDPSDYQSKYNEVLNKGLQNNRISLRNQKYIVVPLTNQRN